MKDTPEIVPLARRFTLVTLDFPICTVEAPELPAKRGGVKGRGETLPIVGPEAFADLA